MPGERAGSCAGQSDGPARRKARRCAACHGGPAPEGLTQPTVGGFGAVTVSYPLRAPRETTACGLCHDVTREQIHPVDVAPSFQVPSDFPLDAGGRLVCSSCHDPHRALQISADGGDPILRGNVTGEAFCQSCHGATGSDPRAWHIVALESAHWDDTREEARGWGLVDRVSARCLGCHDGTVGRNVARTSARQPMGMRRNESHPIGMDYREVALARRLDRSSPELRDVSLLDDRIRLFEGMVGCGSCHNPYSDNPNFLVIDGAGGRLCMSCHAM